MSATGASSGGLTKRSRPDRESRMSLRLPFTFIAGFASGLGIGTDSMLLALLGFFIGATLLFDED